MWESLEAIIKYLDKKDPKTKHTAINTLKCLEPYCDGEGQSYARATDMVREGTINAGQPINEQHKQHGVFAIGFGSCKGTVIAGREWGDDVRIM